MKHFKKSRKCKGMKFKKEKTREKQNRKEKKLSSRDKQCGL